MQIRLADMARRITTAQLLSLQLGRLKDRGAAAAGAGVAGQMEQLRAWRWISPAIAATCWARAGISAEYAPIRHMLNLESVVTYEGTQTIHQLTVGRALTGPQRFLARGLGAAGPRAAEEQSRNPHQIAAVQIPAARPANQTIPHDTSASSASQLSTCLKWMDMCLLRDRPVHH